MDIDHITDLDLLRSLAKHNRMQCIKYYYDDGMHFIKDYWYLYCANSTGGVIIWYDIDIHPYSKHIILSVDDAIKYFDIGL